MRASVFHGIIVALQYFHRYYYDQALITKVAMYLLSMIYVLISCSTCKQGTCYVRARNMVNFYK